MSTAYSLYSLRGKARGGRGVGLYLCRANLTAGGHRIRYELNPKHMPLPGANFLISFRVQRNLTMTDSYSRLHHGGIYHSDPFCIDGG